MNEDLLIEVVNVNKGGGGKTSYTYNRAHYLAAIENKRVLLIDGDHSCNLTNSFEVEHSNSVFNLFKDGATDIVSTGKKNIDIIVGSKLFTDRNLEIEKKNNKFMIFSVWVMDNYEYLSSNYDYILIDTHNDDSLVTANFIAASNIVIAVITPDRHSYSAWLELNGFIEEIKAEAIEPFSKKSYVDTKPFVIANRIVKFGYNFDETTKEFFEAITEEENYLGYIPQKKLLVKSLLENKSIYEQYDEMPNSDREKHQKFFDDINFIYNRVSEIIKE